MRIETSKILTLADVQTVIASLKRKRHQSMAQTNLIIFRLATCCGLRASEISELTLSDVVVDGNRPHLIVQHGKGDKRRRVPLNWDESTLNDLQSWIDKRVADGATPMDHVVVTGTGKRIDRSNLRKRFVNMTTKAVARAHTIHDGRHTFVSLSIAGGQSLPAVRDAAGHSSLAVTNIYSHAIPDETVGNIFATS